MTFGLLIDWVSSSYHQEVWMGIQTFCRERGVNLLTLVTGRPGSPFRWEQMRNQLLEFVDGRRFDGFLFMTATLGNHLEPDQFQMLLDRVAPAPVVSLGAELKGVPTVLVDNRASFRGILGHLVEGHGCTRFAFAGGPDYNGDARERKRLLLDFLKTQNLEIRPDRIVSGEFTTAWGQEVVERLIPGDRPDFDVLVCADDDIALGVLDALAQKGLQVPGDLAVTGFDDVFSSRLAALTTARQPLGAMGWTAAAHLYERVEGREVEAVTRKESQIVLRQSCGCLSPAAKATQVEPRPETDRSFSEVVRDHGDQLLEELRQEGLPEGPALAIRGHFLRAWEAQDGRMFLHGVQHVLTDMAALSLPPGHLHYPLSILRRWVLRSTESAARRSFTETTIHQARILLTEALHTQSVQKETHQILLKDLLSDLNERLVYSRTFADQAVVMLDLFPKLGISAFRLSLYEDPCQPMVSARLVLTEAGLVPGNGILYDPKNLFAGGHEPTTEPWSYVAEALFDRNAPLGFFLLDAKGDVELLAVFDQLCERVGRGVETVRRIQDLEDQVARRTTELSQALSELEANNRKLKDMALKDELTGLYNRRGFLMLSEHLLAAHRRNGRPLVLFFGDLDGLKKVNDTWGHDAGDDAIRTCGRLFTETFRADDVIARLGGDEFAVLAPECTPEAAQALADRISAAIDQSGEDRYGLSTGWVALDPQSHQTLGEWMREADKNLYREKLMRKSRRGA